MRRGWALFVFTRLTAHSQAVFSVQNDLLAYPQFEVVYSESFISTSEAEARLAFAESPSQERGDQYVAAAAPAQGAQADLSYDLETSEWNLHGVRHPTSSKDTHEKMIFDGRPHLCTIPHIPSVDSNSSQHSGSAEEQHQELVRASQNGWELLKGMEDNCLYWPTYRRSWWVYSFCYNAAIRQFHPLDPGRGGPLFPPVEDPEQPSFSLAKFEVQKKKKQGKNAGSENDKHDISRRDADSLPSQLQTHGETKYLVQKLDGGTVCDLTGFERRVEVQFHCNPNLPDRIRMIKETASCVYLIVIDTPRLCNDVAFRPPQIDKAHPITCQEIVAPDAIAKWKAAKAAQARAIFKTQEDEAAAADSIPLVVGDIVVGAQKLVGGSPDKIIKASKIVSTLQKGAGEGKEAEKEYVLARSDGTNLFMTNSSEREMQDLGLDTSPKEIRRMIEAIQKATGGRKWKLVAVRTAEGVRHNLIIDDDQEATINVNKDGSTDAKADAEAKAKKEEKAAGSEEEYK